MNGLCRHLRASSFPSLIRSFGGINSVSRFSSQSDGFSGHRFGEQGAVPGDSKENSSLPNAGRIDPNASTFRTFREMRSDLLNKGGNSFSAPNAPPTFRTAERSQSPNPPSYQNFAQSSLLKGKTDLDFVKEIIARDEERKTTGLFSHFHRPNIETNADIIHIKMLRNNTFVTVTNSKGDVKCKATSGSLPDLKGGRKMTNYTADATAENIGRRAKAMGLKSVVVKVNGFTHFSKKRKAIIAFRDGFTNSRSDQNPIVYIEDTTRKAHNGCRLPRKRRV